MSANRTTAFGDDLLRFVDGRRFSTLLADPPWRFSNRTGKMAPEHRRLSRYKTMTLDDILALPIARIVKQPAHLYLWVPNALLAEGLQVMAEWGFTYKTNVVWYKIRKDAGPDRRGVGFYFRNVTELVLFGIQGKNARTLKAGRRQPNLVATRKREHSRKPDELYDIIEACSRRPYLELFARYPRVDWLQWGDEISPGAPQEETLPLFAAAARARARHNGAKPKLRHVAAWGRTVGRYAR